jgi:membrane associated rhomboid family serine protease
VGFRWEGLEGGEAFPLRGARAPIALEAEGVRHPASPRRSAGILTRYRDVTHVALSARALWLGTRSSVYVLPHGLFRQHGAPERLARALRERIAALPDGTARIAALERLDQLAARAPQLRATWTLIALCACVYALELALGAPVVLAGHYSPALVADGDMWRIFTANLLHAQGGAAGYAHIVLNLIALWVLGPLVERPLGAARTACAMGAAAVGAMLTAGAFGNTTVVGASGIAFGLVGSALWLDHRRSGELPADWRFPRRGLWLLVAINAVIGVLLPFIALAAHLGGLVAGALATAAVARRIAEPPPAWVRAACAGLLLATGLSLATAAADVAREGSAIARYAARYAQLPGIGASELNDHAWMIAISPRATREELEAALRLAERAVLETHRSEAAVLDTLAELQFALGLDAEALETIDEAIALEPDEPYFAEQRRRFTGERARADRPEYLPLPLREREPDPPATDAEREAPDLTA